MGTRPGFCRYRRAESETAAAPQRTVETGEPRQPGVESVDASTPRPPGAESRRATTLSRRRTDKQGYRAAGECGRVAIGEEKWRVEPSPVEVEGRDGRRIRVTT